MREIYEARSRAISLALECHRWIALSYTPDDIVATAREFAGFISEK